MSPKVQFTKEQLIDAAFAIAAQEGLNAITARKVAKALGCSVAPIYVNFDTSGDLIEAVIQRAGDIAYEYMQKDYGQSPFLNMGIGVIMVANQYPRLFRDVVLNRNRYLTKGGCERDRYLKIMKKDPHLSAFTDEDLLYILLRVDVFTHGLALLASDEHSTTDFSEQQIITILEETGSDIILGTMLRKKGAHPICKLQ